MVQLKSIREKKGISQVQLAAMLGVSQGTISAWETGRWEPSIDGLRSLANHLNCSIEELIGGLNVQNES